MKLHERLAALVAALPDDASVTVTGGMLREWISEDEDVATASPAGTPSDQEDRLLTADEVAEILAVDRTWVHRHAENLPFARKLSSGTLRFSSKGLQRWVASKRL